MAWNLNNYENEYELFDSQTEEQIDMFGLTVSYVKAEGVNLDEIFGEYTHKKLLQNNILEVNVLPENSEEFESLGTTFSKMGILNTETFNCYISRAHAEKIGYEDIRTEAVGDLLVLPNGKKFEITFVDHEVRGTNNMFPYANQKNVFMLKAKIWSYNSDSKEEGSVVTDLDGNESIEDKLETFNFTSLDEIFTNDDTTPPAEGETKPEPKKRLKTQDEEAEKLHVDTSDVFGEWG